MTMEYKASTKYLCLKNFSCLNNDDYYLTYLSNLRGEGGSNFASVQTLVTIRWSAELRFNV